MKQVLVLDGLSCCVDPPIATAKCTLPAPAVSCRTQAYPTKTLTTLRALTTLRLTMKPCRP